MPALSHRHLFAFFIIFCLHLAAIWMLTQGYHGRAAISDRGTRILFLQNSTPIAVSESVSKIQGQQLNRQSSPRKIIPIKPKVKLTSHDAKVADITIPRQALEHPSPSLTNVTSSRPEAELGVQLNRDVGRISQLLERDQRFEEQKLQAAKPPNQIVREYWEKQNHPYKDKWDQLAHSIEKAGKPRDLQVETFKSWDGTQISKIDGRCYKAPDPGRTYLHQEEVRQVICPR